LYALRLSAASSFRAFVSAVARKFRCPCLNRSVPRVTHHQTAKCKGRKSHVELRPDVVHQLDTTVAELCKPTSGPTLVSERTLPLKSFHPSVKFRSLTNGVLMSVRRASAISRCSGIGRLPEGLLVPCVRCANNLQNTGLVTPQRARGRLLPRAELGDLEFLNLFGWVKP